MSNTDTLPTSPRTFVNHINRTPEWDAKVEVTEVESSRLAHDASGRLIFTDNDGIKEVTGTTRHITVTATRWIGSNGAYEKVIGTWVTSLHPISGKETNRTKFLGGTTYGSWHEDRRFASARKLYFNVYDHTEFGG